jgi:hypothetical protein
VVSAKHSSIEVLAGFAGWKSSADLADAQGRNGWERDIVSYMQSIDGEYVVNENVTVDDCVPLANRRENPAIVWEVLSSGSPYIGPTMTVDNAKLAAKRYHAFLAFIDGARANRKGAWDLRYTAKALNDYMRAGFGKDPASIY